MLIPLKEKYVVQIQFFIASNPGYDNEDHSIKNAINTNEKARIARNVK